MSIVRRGGLVYSSMEEESFRLRELQELELVGSGPEPAFDRITRLVAEQFAVPTCLISLVTEDRQWFKSCIGVTEELREGTEREAAFCQYVVALKTTLVVEDAREDSRFARNRLVTQDNGFRFYAGAPLRTSTGAILGTLCILDVIPRSLDRSQVAQLETLAEWALSEIVLRRELKLRTQQEKALLEEKRRLLEQQETLERVLRLLDRRHRLIHRILQASREGMLLVDEDGKLLFHNRNMLTMGLLPSEVTPDLASFLEQLLPRQAGLRTGVLQPLFEQNCPFVCKRFSLTDPLGVRGNRCFELYASPVSEAGETEEKRYYLLAFRDRTEEEKAEELKSEFISTVSHELRTPMTSIRGFVEILLNRPVSQERQTRYLQTIDREAIRLSALIDDFLDLQRMEADRLPLRMEPLELGALLIRVAQEGADSLPFRLRLPEQPAFVQGDAERLRQALRHLLDNARKHAPDTEAVELAVRIEGPYAVIDVRDFGPGIPEASLPYLFDKFYRVDNSDRRQSGGTGLGLAIVKHIVESHQGAVTVSSTLGEGSTFTIRVPFADA